EAEAAGIVLVQRVVEALRRGRPCRVRCAGRLFQTAPRIWTNRTPGAGLGRHEIRRNRAKPVYATRDAALRQESTGGDRATTGRSPNATGRRAETRFRTEMLAS